MESFNFTAFFIFIISFVLALFLVPKVRWIVKNRGLIDHPDIRSSHKDSTPTMGGIAFFLIILFISSILKPWDNQAVSINLISALGLIFAIGIKDDLMVSTARAKIGAQLLAILFILFCNCLEFNSFNGFLGIYDVPTLLSYALVIIMFLTILNSFNLIDGIDGLASSIGIVIFTIYAFLFIQFNLHYFALLALSLVGILMGYLRYNLSKKDKIFMGDTGSLIIGFCIALFSLKFLTIDVETLSANSFNAENSIIVVGAIFFIPLFDTLRIMGVRLINGKSPFDCDNNHIHHILLKLGFNHIKSSLILSIANLIVAISAIILSKYLNSLELLSVMILYFIIFTITFYVLKTKYKLKFN
jgi:UDP-N-acetylmuramyl pentapeptide phosphotransferase/UDP-N-acetylglucosamine-1-phosphate transferase